MEIIAASIPSAVRAPGLQPGLPPARLQLLQQTRATASPIAVSEQKVATTAVNRPATVAEPINKNLEVMRQQLYEFSFGIVTGAFSRFVVNFLGLAPAALSSQEATAGVVPELASAAVSQPSLPVQPSVIASAPEDSSPASDREPANELTQPLSSPPVTATPFGVNVAAVQAVAVQPPAQAQAVQVSPALEIVADVTKTSPYTALEQQKGHRLDTFDVQGGRNRDVHPQELFGSRLDITA